jgi:hypothetical protein
VLGCAIFVSITIVNNDGWMMLPIVVSVVCFIIVLNARMLSMNIVALMEQMVALTHTHYQSKVLHNMKFSCAKKVMVVTILGMDLISTIIL